MAKGSTSSPGGAPKVSSPGPNEGPYPKEIRIALTERQKAHLEAAAGNDTIASHVRDKLFYAAPDEVSTIGAIGSIYQAAGQVIEAAAEVRIQVAKTGRAIESIASIVKHKDEASERLPKDVVVALRPASEQADRLLELGAEFHRLAQQLAAENLLGVLRQNPVGDIRPRPRSDR